MHERLRVFLRDSYKSGKMTKDAVLATMGKFSRILPEGGAFMRNCEVLYYDYDLVEGGMISEKKFDAVMLDFLENNEWVDTDKYWLETVYTK